MTNNRQLKRKLILFVALLYLLSGCTSSGASSGVSAKLEPGPSAPLGGTIPFRLTVSCRCDVPNPGGQTTAEAFIFLSSGLSLLTSGWTVEENDAGYSTYTQPITFQVNVERTFDFQIRPNHEGQQRIDAGAKIAIGKYGREGKSDTKLLDVTANGTTISDLPRAWPTEVLPCPIPPGEGRSTEYPPCPSQ